MRSRPRTTAEERTRNCASGNVRCRPRLVARPRRKIVDLIANARGVARAFIDRKGELPQFRIEVDRAEAARHGLNVPAIEDVIETALSGKTRYPAPRART